MAACAVKTLQRLSSTCVHPPFCLTHNIAAGHVAEQTAIASTICMLCCAWCLACAVFVFLKLLLHELTLTWCCVVC